MKKLLATFIVILLFLPSCAQKSTKKTNLDDTLFKYASLVRWSDYDSAIRFLKPNDKNIQPTNFELEHLKQFKVTSYSEFPITPSAKDNVILQRVEIQLYNIHSNHTKTIYDNQSWEYDDERKQWFLASGIPRI